MNGGTTDRAALPCAQRSAPRTRSPGLSASRTAGAMERRRLLPRQFTDWRGRYLIEGDPDERWRDCRIVDMSSAGAGLEFLEASPEETAGRNIIIALQFRGEVRHALPSRNEGIRSGVRFVDLTDEHRIYLQSLTELQAVW